MSASKRVRDETNRQRRREGRRNQLPADWSSVSADAIKEAITAITAIGGAIRFGYTRDGGAYAVGILGDGEPYTDYLRPTDDIEAYLNDLSDDFRPQGKPVEAAEASK